MLIPSRSDFGLEWARGIVAYEPPRVGKPFTGLIPSVDSDGNSRAGIRLPEVQVPLATYGGWNYRDPSIRAPDQLAGEDGSFYPVARTRSAAQGPGNLQVALE